jgi:hypothetical protein
MATYPTAKTASTRATATNAAPMADSPVTAYMVVTTPATTVMGAIAERMKYRTAGIPSRSLARAVDSTVGGADVDMDGSPFGALGGGPGQPGRSRVGLRSKKPTGRRVKPQRATGITGQSSGRGKWVIPKVCQSTMSWPSMSRSAAT